MEKPTQFKSDNNPSKNVYYVVLRDGRHVSEREYSTATDSAAVAEQTFWKKVATKHSRGETVEIVEKHR